MDSNTFNSSYHMPYSSQSQQSPAQQAPMGGPYASQSQQAASQPGSQHHSPAQDASHATLPPLQGQNGGYAHFGSMSYAHANSGAPTPTSSHTPTSSSVANGAVNAYSHVSPASAMGPPSSYANHYPVSQGMMYSSPTASALPHSSSSNGLAALRPAIATSLAPLSSFSAPHMGQQTSFLQNEEAPTHVVGSQGRRGILPSAPGRPNAAAPGAGSSLKNMMPQKDADGKFPCPHCNKTYLHAKHLKRHMLRHTGDRPYSCHLCKDTFSRSDILKRHFQKCSIRRGNPTGANHLAHQRRGNNSNRLSMSQQEGPIGLAGLQEVSGAYGNAGMSDHSPTVNGDVSTRTSRANSLISPANMSHRNSIAGLGILGNSGPGGDPLSTQQSYAPNMHSYGLPSVSNSNQVPSAYAFSQQPYFNNPAAQQPLSFLGHSNSRFDHSHSNSPHQQSPNGDANHAHLDNSRIFNQNGQDSFINSNMPAGANAQGNETAKQEHDVKHFPNDLGNDLNSNGNMGVVWS